MTRTSFEQIIYKAHSSQKLIYVQLKTGMMYKGYISDIIPDGFFLHFPDDRGFAAIMLEMVERIFVYYDLG
jgi:hypothetical protein